MTYQEAETLASKDSDGDGVYDWQEKLWGTDPEKPSTFNSIPDKEYIALKQKQIDISDSQNDNKTDILSKQFFATINAVKADSTLNPEDSYKEIANSVAEYVLDNPAVVTSFKSTDLKIVANTEANKANYRKGLGSFSTTYFGKKELIGTETSILYYSLVNEDPSHLPDLDPIIKSYESFAKSLLKVPVPEAAAKDHLDFINTLYRTKQALEDTKSLFSDSVVGIRGVVEYNKANNDLNAIIDNLQKYVSN